MLGRLIQADPLRRAHQPQHATGPAIRGTQLSGTAGDVGQVSADRGVLCRIATKMVIVMRSDLEMSSGKIAAQAAHAAVTAALAAAETAELAAWLEDGQPKVVLRADSLAKLEQIIASAESRSLRVNVIADAGRTELAPGTVR